VSVRRRFAGDRPEEQDPTCSYEQLTGLGQALVAAGFAVEQVYEGWRTVALDVSAAAATVPAPSRRGWFGRRGALAAASPGDDGTVAQVPAEAAAKPADTSEAGGKMAKPADTAAAAAGAEPVPVG
jgi:hypothetical protein